MKTQNGIKRLGAGALKRKFLQCIGLRSTSATALQSVVNRLIDRGISRKTLVAWAVQAGYSQGNVSSLLSKIFCALGLRERRPGAGRKPSPDALELLAHAQARYKERFLRVLQAALRAGKARRTARLSNLAPQSGRATELIAPSQLRNLGVYCASTITRNGKTAGNQTRVIQP